MTRAEIGQKGNCYDPSQLLQLCLRSRSQKAIWGLHLVISKLKRAYLLCDSVTEAGTCPLIHLTLYSFLSSSLASLSSTTHLPPGAEIHPLLCDSRTSPSFKCFLSILRTSIAFRDSREDVWNLCVSSVSPKSCCSSLWRGIHMCAPPSCACIPAMRQG